MTISQPLPNQLKELEKELETQKTPATNDQPPKILQSDSVSMTTTPKPKKHWFKRLIIGLVGIFLIFALALGIILSGLHFVVLNYFVSDIRPIDDSDLRLEKVTISKEENSFYDFQEIGKYLDDSSYPVEISNKVSDHLKGKVWDENFVQTVLAQNEKTLSLFNAAYKKKFQDLRYAEPDKFFSNFGDLSLKINPLASLKVAKLNSLEALYLAHQGKDPDALNEAVKSAEIGQKIQESQGSTLDWLLGMAMKNVGLEAMQKIIATSKLSPETLTQAAQYLEKFKNNEEGLKTAFKAEYVFAINVIDDVTNGINEDLIKKYGNKYDPNFIRSSSQKNNFIFQPNKTKAILADEIRAAINQVEKPCSQTKDLKIKMISPFLTSSSTAAAELKLMITENAIGEILHDGLMAGVNFGAQIDKKCGEDFLVSATQLMFALKAYNLDTGSYPTTLDQLVPKYIPKVYEDPFDGKPIKYSPTKKIIYSVGKDKIDSGGSEGEDWLTMSDPTFKIDF